MPDADLMSQCAAHFPDDLGDTQCRGLIKSRAARRAKTEGECCAACFADVERCIEFAWCPAGLKCDAGPHAVGCWLGDSNISSCRSNSGEGWSSRRMPWRMPPRLWRAVISYDTATLQKPWRNAQLMAAFSARNLAVAPILDEVATRGRAARHKAMLVDQLLAHGHAERCALAGAGKASAAGGAHENIPILFNGTAVSCRERVFDNAQLPFRWLPGLPVLRLPDLQLRRCGEPGFRLEVMHVTDYQSGPMWLYSAPKSGVWWDPGRCVIARNLVSAVLRWRPLADVADALRRRRSDPAYPQWSAAFGHERWEEVLAGADSGDARYARFAMAGPLLADLLTPPRDTVDSILMLEQMHLWPRESEYSFAPEAISQCGDPPPKRRERWGAVRSRLWHVPEIIDLRAVTGRKSSRHERQRQRAARFLSSDAAGTQPCELNARSPCLSCSADVAALCSCAFTKAPPVSRVVGSATPLQTTLAKRRGSLTQPRYNGAAARECWLQRAEAREQRCAGVDETARPRARTKSQIITK